MRAGEHWTERSNFQLEFTFIYYDIVHEVQGNIKRNELKRGKRENIHKDNIHKHMVSV